MARSNQETDDGKNASPCLTQKAPYKGLGAESEEKREPVSDIDTAVVDNLKALDPDGRLEKRTIGSIRRMGKAKRAHHLFAAEVRVGNGQAPLPVLRNWVREFEPISGLGVGPRLRGQEHKHERGAVFHVRVHSSPWPHRCPMAGRGGGARLLHPPHPTHNNPPCRAWPMPR